MSSINPARTMERALRKAITAAVKQAAQIRYESQPEDVTEAFIGDLFAILFPTPVKKDRKTKTKPASDTESVSGTESEGKKERKKPGPKPKAKTDSESEAPKERKKPGPKPKVDADGNPIAKKKPGPKPKAKAEGEASGSESEGKKERKKPGPKPKNKDTGSESDASASSKTSEKKKPGPKPKAKPAEANVDALTAFKWKKAKEAGVTDKKAFVAYLNGLTKEAYDAIKTEAHALNFVRAAAVAPEPVPVVEEFSAVSVPVAEEKKEEEATELDAVEVEFKGKTYCVDPENKKVYDAEGEFLGYAGMGAFKGMVLPDDE